MIYFIIAYYRGDDNLIGNKRKTRGSKSAESSMSEIEYKINEYTLTCFKVMLAVLFGIWIFNRLNIFIVNQDLMTRGFLTVFVIIFITLIIGKLIDLHKPIVKYILLFNVVLSITLLGMTITYHTVILSVIPLVLAIQYADNKVTFYTYALSIVSIFAIVMGGYFYGLCDANMLAFTTEPTAYYYDDVTNTINFQFNNTNPWYTLPLYFVLPRCVILLIMLPVIKKISANIMQYAETAVNMKKLSETDEMTGVYNKNKYLQMVRDVYSKLDNVGVMFFDVNNLKIINDTLGHAKGDMVITYAANIIKKLQTENRKAYRLGGDEFVLFIENPDNDVISDIFKMWDEFTMAKLIVSKYSVSIAVGYASGPGKDLDNIIKKADENMYKNKDELKTLSN